MTLTDLANHVCTQCGMADTDDLAAAKTFAQRRLEMIWNTQLWRNSLIEATMTLNPDGTCNLANTIWIPSRSTLLLPQEFDSVLAVRADNHTLNVASLESYYRTDTDWLNMLGDPTEFQILSPAVYESASATSLVLASDTIPVTAQAVYTADGIANTKVAYANLPTNAGFPTAAMSVAIASALRVLSMSASQAATLYAFSPTLIGTSFQWFPNITIPLPITAAQLLALLTAPSTAGTSFVVNVVSIDKNGAQTSLAAITYDHGMGAWSGWDGVSNLSLTVPVSAVTVNCSILIVFGSTVMNVGLNVSGGATALAVDFVAQTLTQTVGFTTVATSTDGTFPRRQRIRLTTTPQLAVNLRILGKTECPVLGPYDTFPINNVEPCLIAVTRGDMLLRQRQNGKAQLAASEGATLLAQLARSEAFQTANNFRIQPENGFGGDNFISQPNSLHPL